jgi:hypothetical protein
MTRCGEPGGVADLSEQAEPDFESNFNRTYFIKQIG